jgi:hypothetical protein
LKALRTKNNRWQQVASVMPWLALTGALIASCGGSRDPVPGIGHHSTSAGSSGLSAATAGTTATVDPNDVGIAGSPIEIKPAWDWNGVIGTGQSLAVGNTPTLSKEQRFNNLMLVRENVTAPPWEPENAALTMGPLIEINNHAKGAYGGYPAPYPFNLWGETPHSAMATEITRQVHYASGSDYVTVHTIVGESGQGMVAINKQTGDTTGQTGRAYAASLFETAAITRLARAAGKTYGVGVIVMTHGETDSGSASYRGELIKLLADYNTDIAAITGQAIKIPMFLSQQFAFPSGAGQRPESNQVQWQLGVDKPGDFVCTGPKYQYDGHGDGTHLSSVGYQQLGEKTGQVYFERIVLGHDWQPLYPLSATRDGQTITVKFHVPVPPLMWDDSFPDPDTDWPQAKGFELFAGGTSLPIASVAIVGDSVVITSAAALPATGVMVGYAMAAGKTKMPTLSRAYRWGKLRDSDPFVGWTTKLPQPNYAVSFQLAAVAAQ